MKRFLTFLFALCFASTLAGCAVGFHGAPAPDNVPEQGTPDGPENIAGETAAIYLTVDDRKAAVAPESNAAAAALVEILKEHEITLTADDYGGFEKVGSLGYALPSQDVRTTAQAGDVMLYSGNQIVLFYGANSWSYTKLGKITGLSVSELRAFLRAGEGRVQVTIGLK